MQEKYVTPDVQLAGEADKVILGSGGGGGDYGGELTYPDMEFETDGNVVTAE